MKKYGFVSELSLVVISPSCGHIPFLTEVSMGFLSVDLLMIN